ncbi:MAG: glycosyltransferase family 39 protein [Candidatus Methanoperedens sp.]|nr:glycosyltransferase family 39 protein [Candidatus Methanoperedens sp.]
MALVSINFIRKIIENNLVIVLLLIGISARVLLFGSIPPGLNQDEASTGYDAYAILNYGMDRNGFHNPVHITSWGSGQSALYVYFAMPFIALFGLNVMAIRAVNLVFGIISLLVFYFLVKRVSNRPVALLSLFLLVISPWHIMMSRWAIDANLFPSVFLMAVFLLVLSFDDKRFLPASLFVFALSLYAYPTAFFIIPIYLLVVLSYLLYHKKIDIKNDFKNLGTGILLFAFTALPIFLFVIINYFKMDSIHTALFSVPRLTGPPRFSVASSLFNSDSQGGFYQNIIEVLKIIINQDDGLIWNSIPEYGYMFLFSLPFLVVGFLKLVSENVFSKTRKFEKSFVFLAWLAVSFLLGSLLTPPNINRINILFIPLIFLIAAGIYYVVQNFRYFTVPIIILYVVSFSMFSFNYFSAYPEKTEQTFFESFGEAINYASDYASERPDARIYVTNQVNMPYIYVLFYQRINPEIFKSSVKFYNPGAEFQRVESFGRYRFGINDVDRYENAVYIIHNSEEEKFDKSDFTVKRFKYYSVMTRK